MKYKICILGIVFFLLLGGCKKDWEDHYNTQPVTSNTNLWEALQKDENLSVFVSYMKKYSYDTLFLTNNTYTIFAPDNDAFTQFLTTDSVTTGLLDYLICVNFIQSESIKGARKIQTMSEKYALFVNNSTGISIDDISLDFESPVYRNGKYFIIGKVAVPKPNLYEYIAKTNPVLKKYVDSQDTLILDKERSTPIGFDEHGNTIYDTVAVMGNKFEDKFFPISEEFRTYTATLVFPKEENYNDALTAMVQTMNAGYTDYRDVPEKWQNDVLIPYLLEHGVFMNMLEREEFLRKSLRDTVKLQNILGDSVIIDYQPGEKTICSNGYAYNYSNFVIPDTLYAAPTVYEAEWLLKSLGGVKYAWNPGVTVKYDIGFAPEKYLNAAASNDTIMAVYFTNNYAGKYSVEFNVDNLFPRKYLMVFRTIMRVGGLYEIYVNNQLVRTFDYYDFNDGTPRVWSVTGLKRYIPTPDGYNRFDCWLENLTEYGKAKVRIEYKGPSTMIPRNGLALDYIQFVPY
jgi:uncharacterized surface protein with fasciclin (FAS1) repeats